MANIKFSSAIIAKAKLGNKDSIRQMFSSFICEDEQIIDTEYFGKYGVFFPTLSFVCITDKKLYVMEYGPWNKIVITDAFIEEINSGIIYQPSLFALYFVGIVLCTTIVGILLLNFWVKLYYSLHKSGMVWCIREGINVYAFANRSKINLVNSIWRQVSFMRNQRKLYVK